MNFQNRCSSGKIDARLLHELGVSVTIQGWNFPFLYGGYIEKSDRKITDSAKKKQHVSEVNKLVIQTRKNFPSSYHVYIQFCKGTRKQHNAYS